MASSSWLSAARWLRLSNIETLCELVVLSAINEILTINVRELVIMSVDNYLTRHEALESIVMPLHDDLLSLTVVFAFYCTWITVWEDVIVVAVYHDFRRFGVFLEYDLVIVPIDSNACDIVLRLNVECDIVIVNNQALRLSHWLRLLLAVATASMTAWSLLLIRIRVLILSSATTTLISL